MEEFEGPLSEGTKKVPKIRSGDEGSIRETLNWPHFGLLFFSKRSTCAFSNVWKSSKIT
jgi:hypothetical protein